MGLIIIVAVYLVLGFMLAWIAGMVAREEVTVTTGVVTLIVDGVAGIIINMALETVLPEGAIRIVADTAVSVGVLTLALHLIAKLSWKHAAIIAAIYSVVINGVLFGVASCAR